MIIEYDAHRRRCAGEREHNRGRRWCSGGDVGEIRKRSCAVKRHRATCWCNEERRREGERESRSRDARRSGDSEAPSVRIAPDCDARDAACAPIRRESDVASSERGPGDGARAEQRPRESVADCASGVGVPAVIENFVRRGGREKVIVRASISIHDCMVKMDDVSTAEREDLTSTSGAGRYEDIGVMKVERSRGGVADDPVGLRWRAVHGAEILAPGVERHAAAGDKAMDRPVSGT